MILYRKGTRYLGLVGGIIVGSGLLLFINAGVNFPSFIPYCIFVIGAIVFICPKRKIYFDENYKVIVVKELNRKITINILDIRSVLRDNTDIVIKTDTHTHMLCHADFDDCKSEQQFITLLTKYAINAHISVDV